MLIRSRPSKTERAFRVGPGVGVVATSAIAAVACLLLGRPQLLISFAVFPVIYFALMWLGLRIRSCPAAGRCPLPESPWTSVLASTAVAFSWGFLLLVLYIFMVTSMHPAQMHAFVRMPRGALLTIRNTEYAIAVLASAFVVLDYVRCAGTSRARLDVRAIATALVLEFVIVTLFAVY